jgi:two-component system, response regulator YesN
VFTLLIADDERLEREALKFIIQRGTDRIGGIFEAVNGREAVELAEKEHPDIVIMDIKMPGVNGVEAARRVKELSPGSRILFLTAFDTFDYAREALRIGAEDFLVKPVEDDRLLELIEELCGRLEAERRLRLRADRDRETLHELESLLEKELCGQLESAYVDPRRLEEYAAVNALTEPRFLAGLLEVDLNSYPMRIERSDHADILLGRCEHLCRREAEQGGWRCLGGRRNGRLRENQGEIVLLLCRSGEHPALPPGELEKRILKVLKEGVSLSARICLGTEAESPDQLAESFARIKPADSFGQRRSAAHLEEQLAALLESADPDAGRKAGTLVFDWLDGHPERDEGMKQVEEILLVLRHQLVQRYPRMKSAAGNFSPGRRCGRDEWNFAVRSSLGALAESLRLSRESCRHPAVRFVLELLDARYAEDLPLEEIAELAGRSASHLSRLFRQETGMSVVEYMTRVRVAAAKRLLSDGERSIRAVSRRVGYGDPNYFSRVFRRETGLTPREYRLQLKIE